MLKPARRVAEAAGLIAEQKAGPAKHHIARSGYRAPYAARCAVSQRHLDRKQPVDCSCVMLFASKPKLAVDSNFLNLT